MSDAVIIAIIGQVGAIILAYLGIFATWHSRPPKNGNGNGKDHPKAP